MKRLLPILFLLATVASATYPVWGVDTLYIYTFDGESTAVPRTLGARWTAPPKWYVDSMLLFGGWDTAKLKAGYAIDLDIDGDTVTVIVDSTTLKTMLAATFFSNGAAPDSLKDLNAHKARIYSYLIAGSADTSLIDGLPVVGPGNWLVVDGKRGAIFCGSTDSVISTSGLPWHSVAFGVDPVVGETSVVGGGWGNHATGLVSFIGGGQSNSVSGNLAAIVAGFNNAAPGVYSFVGGGSADTASGSHATIGGGHINRASGGYSTIPGGDRLTVSGLSSFATGVNGTVTEDSTAAFCHQHVVVNGDTNFTGKEFSVNGDIGTTGRTTIWGDLELHPKVARGDTWIKIDSLGIIEAKDVTADSFHGALDGNAATSTVSDSAAKAAYADSCRAAAYADSCRAAAYADSCRKAAEAASAESLDHCTITMLKDTFGSGVNDSAFVYAVNPPGTVIYWYGDSVNWPSGYRLCNGVNYYLTSATDSLLTPDMRNVYLIGANGDSAGKPSTTISGAEHKSGGSTAYTPAGTNDSVPANASATAREGTGSAIASASSHMHAGPVFRGTPATIIMPYRALWPLIRSFDGYGTVSDSALYADTADYAVNAATATNADTAAVLAPAAPDSTVPLRGDGAAARPVGVFYEYDALSVSTYTQPWYFAAIASGTVSGLVAGYPTHPGIARISSSTSANSGYNMSSYERIWLCLAGGEQSDFIVRPESLTTMTCFMGFHDANNQTRPVDGVYFNITGTTARGFTSSNNTRDSTASTYTLTKNLWYWLNVTVATTTKAYFTIRDSVGTQVFKDSLATNIPSTAGRELGHGVVATWSGTTAAYCLDLDYMNLKISRKICAGSPR